MNSKNNRFRIDRLEERLAPGFCGCGCFPCGGQLQLQAQFQSQFQGQFQAQFQSTSLSVSITVTNNGVTAVA